MWPFPNKDIFSIPLDIIFFGYAEWEISVFWPVIESCFHCSLNHWTTREVPSFCIFALHIHGEPNFHIRCVSVVSCLVCCSSVAKWCLSLCDPMDCCMPGFPVLHYCLSFIISWSLLKLMSTEVVMTSNHLILCCPVLLLPSILPMSLFQWVRVFSKESALHIRWPKYWSFSFSISPSNEYSGLISFRIDLFALGSHLMH